MKKPGRNTNASAAPPGKKPRTEELPVDHPHAHLIPEGSTFFSKVFAPTAFFAIESRLSNNDQDILPRDLAAAIEANPGQPLPTLMRERVCLLLRGKYKRQPGPKPSLSREMRALLARLHYLRRLEELRTAKARGAIARKSKAEDPLHRQAAKEAIEEIGLKITVERFLNSMSEDNSTRLGRPRIRK